MNIVEFLLYAAAWDLATNLSRRAPWPMRLLARDFVCDPGTDRWLHAFDLLA